MGPLFVMVMAFSTMLSLVVTGLVVKYGKSWKLMDDPARHKHPKVVHTVAVPRGGAIPVFITLLVGTLLFMPLSVRSYGILIGAAVIAVIGIIDDRFEERVSPYTRLVVNFIAGLVVIGTGIGIAYITNPFGGVLRLDQPQLCFNLIGERCIWVLSDLFALIWLVWMQNIVGWSSGVDGQLPGFVVVAALVLGLLGLRFGGDAGQMPVVVLAAITAGAYLGFLGWNWYPQKIIPGYGGKSLAGFLLGVLAILSGAKVGALITVLGVPFIDAGMVIIKRIREGRSPVWGGREHLHHYLLEMGWTKQKIASFYTGISIFFGFLALQLKAESKYFTMATILLLIFGGILWLHYFSTYLKQHDHDNG